MFSFWGALCTTRSKREESLEQGKLEFRDAKSGSVSSVGQTGGRKEGGGKYGREVGWGRGQETEENAAVRAEGGGDMAVESKRAAAPEEGIFTAIFSTTYPQIPCPNL